MNYDCIIVGGGIAGLQAAIQLGRYKHKVLVIDSNHGRSTLCKSYHNILGWPDGISGQELRQIGKRQAEGERGFIAFGGNEVKSDLAKQLGVELLENQHIVVNPRTKMTNIPYVWAAGDVVAHSEQVTIAMGEGSGAAIWIHKSLMDEREV